MHLEEIMNTNVRTVSINDSAEHARAMMSLYGIHHLVALEEGRLAGVVSIEDLGGRKGGADLTGKTVADLMTPHVISATPETTVREAANLLRGYSVGCLPILKDGKIKGLVTVTDLLSFVGRGTHVPRRTQYRGVHRQETHVAPKASRSPWS